ncbi:MAG: hypothetical protein VYD19_00800 [Myxococcota bacterium]|nr:hypothetical protein [Myxococcota bacterium]
MRRSEALLLLGGVFFLLATGCIEAPTIPEFEVDQSSEEDLDQAGLPPRVRPFDYHAQWMQRSGEGLALVFETKEGIGTMLPDPPIELQLMTAPAERVTALDFPSQRRTQRWVATVIATPEGQLSLGLKNQNTGNMMSNAFVDANLTGRVDTLLIGAVLQESNARQITPNILRVHRVTLNASEVDFDQQIFSYDNQVIGANFLLSSSNSASLNCTENRSSQWSELVVSKGEAGDYCLYQSPRFPALSLEAPFILEVDFEFPQLQRPKGIGFFLLNSGQSAP